MDLGEVAEQWNQTAKGCFSPATMTLSLTELERKLPAILSGRQSPDLFRGSPLGPQLSYGRHRGPNRKDSRQAAVLAAIYQTPEAANDEDSLVVVLTRRPTTLAHHGGQVCLPGGRIESGETSLAACLREFHEELGVKAQLRRDLGTLPPMYVFASDNQVTSHVVTIETPQLPWAPDPGEVDTVLEVPLSQLGRVAKPRSTTAPDARVDIVDCTVDRRGKPQSPQNESATSISLSFSYRAIQFQRLHSWHVQQHPEQPSGQLTGAHFATHQIWGATGLLLEQLAVAIEQAMGG